MGVLGVLVVVAAVGAGLWAGQRRLIYFPDRTAPSLSLIGPGWEEVAYQTTDGLTLGAWYRAPEPGRPVVVVFSGNAGNRADRASLGAGLANTGMGVLLTDYRGYGGNPGPGGEPRAGGFDPHCGCQQGTGNGGSGRCRHGAPWPGQSPVQ